MYSMKMQNNSLSSLSLHLWYYFTSHQYASFHRQSSVTFKQLCWFWRTNMKKEILSSTNFQQLLI